MLTRVEIENVNLDPLFERVSGAWWVTLADKPVDGVEVVINVVLDSDLYVDGYSEVTYPAEVAYLSRAFQYWLSTPMGQEAIASSIRDSLEAAAEKRYGC